MVLKMGTKLGYGVLPRGAEDGKTNKLAWISCEEKWYAGSGPETQKREK